MFDVVVVGSGISGGWAAKTLTEAGLKTLMVERGPAVVHGAGYVTENKEPWDFPWRGAQGSAELRQAFGASYSGEISEANRHFFATQASAPFRTPAGQPFHWIRGHQLGGRSLTWGRGVPRWSPADFGANAKDGHGTAWPVTYADIAPWYDLVETFIGVSGARDGLAHWPDGIFQPPFALNAMEEHLRASIQTRFPDRRLIAPRLANLTQPIGTRGTCQARDQCSRGCSYGAYFSTQSSTLPAAEATGRLMVQTDTIAEKLLTNERGDRVTGLVCIDTRTGARTVVNARSFVLAASAFSSVHLLLNSRSSAHPEGLGGNNRQLGRHVMDHVMCSSASGVHQGLQDDYYRGRRPIGTVLPRFQNLSGQTEDFTRGYFYSVATWRAGWSAALDRPGFGAQFKASLGKPGPWKSSFLAFGECLPNTENRITLGHESDRFGTPLLKIQMRFGENEERMMRHARREAKAMLIAAGFAPIAESEIPESPGMAVHEMGGARMGFDPRTSITNARSRLHAANNVAIVDGAVMASSACQNPSLTYMALAARACTYLALDVKEGRFA